MYFYYYNHKIQHSQGYNKTNLNIESKATKILTKTKKFRKHINK